VDGVTICADGASALHERHELPSLPRSARFASNLRKDCIRSVENRGGHRFSAYGPAVTERQLGEIERVLLYVGDARSRADRAAAALEREDAPAHMVAALADTARRMGEAYRALSQRTYYAVAPETDR